MSLVCPLLLHYQSNRQPGIVVVIFEVRVSSSLHLWVPLPSLLLSDLTLDVLGRPPRGPDLSLLSRVLGLTPVYFSDLMLPT